MRRAGLDYHEYAGIFTYESWEEFKNSHENSRIFGISTKGDKAYHSVEYRDDDFVVFGPETRGLPDSIREDIGQDKVLRIPMLPDSRSLNLSNSAAVIVYEAWRQLGFVEGL